MKKLLILFLIPLAFFAFANTDNDGRLPKDLFFYFLTMPELDSKIYSEWRVYLSRFDENKQNEIRKIVSNFFEKDLKWRLKVEDLKPLVFQENKIPDIKSHLQSEIEEMHAAYERFSELIAPNDAPESKKKLAGKKLADESIRYRLQNQKEFLQRFLPEFYSVEEYGDIEQQVPDRKKYQMDMHAKRMILFNNPLLAESALNDRYCINNIQNPDNILKSWCFDESLRIELEKLSKQINDIPYKKESFYDFYIDDFEDSCSQEEQASSCILNVARETLSKYTEGAETVKKEISDLIQSTPDENQSKPLLDSIAGVYKPKFQITVFNGDNDKDDIFDVENIFEIVPIDNVAAYVKLKTITTNGHTCGMQGIFKYSGSNTLSYIDTSSEAFHGICRMKMNIDNNHIEFSDTNGECKRQSCGARGGYDGLGVPLKLKRKIKYMDLIKASEEFQQAVDKYNSLINQ